MLIRYQYVISPKQCKDESASERREMLWRITEQCFENCSHCMIDASPDKKHMDDSLIDPTLAFIQRIKPSIVLITGGEPTLHPHWYEITDNLAKLVRLVILCSNGSFIEDDRKRNLMKELIKKGVAVQVRTHPEFYPNFAKTVKNKNRFENLGCDFFTDGIISLTRSGRALNSFPDFKNSVCACTNLCLAAKQIAVEDWIPFLENEANVCKPTVGIEGTIHLGEAVCCPSVGSVHSMTLEELFLKAKSHSPKHCNRCSGWDELVRKHPLVENIFEK